MKTFSEKLQSVLRYPEMIEAIADILDAGVKQGYPDENWLKPDGSTMSRKANYASKTRHSALHFSGQMTDTKSGMYHLAHDGTRSLMELTRIKRGIEHPDNLELQTIQTEPARYTELLREANKIEHANMKSWACDNGQCRCHDPLKTKEERTIEAKDE